MGQGHQGHGGKEVGAIHDGHGKPAHRAVGIGNHVEIAVPGRGLGDLREIAFHPGGADQGDLGRFGVQEPHHVIGGGLEERSPHELFRLNPAGLAAHAPEEEPQDGGRTLPDDLGQVTVHVGPLFLHLQEFEDLRRDPPPGHVLAQVLEGLVRCRFFFFGKDDVQGDDPGTGLFQPGEQPGHVLPGPGPAAHGLQAVVVNGHDDHLLAGRDRAPEPELEIVELEFEKLAEGGTPDEQGAHQQGDADDPAGDGRLNESGQATYHGWNLSASRSWAGDPQGLLPGLKLILP